VSPGTLTTPHRGNDRRGKAFPGLPPLGRRRKELNAMDYLVSWEIDVFDAATPIEAALQARKAQTRPDTIATVFTVLPKDGRTPVQVDLTELAEEGKIARIPCSPDPAFCTAAVLNRIKQSPLKPTALLSELQMDHYSYTEIQDALSGLLESRDVVLTTDLFLEVATKSAE